VGYRSKIVTASVHIGSHAVGRGHKPLLIAGPCVIESSDRTLDIARRLAALDEVADFTVVFKASYLKDNRTSGSSFRGPGIDEGLAVLAAVREETGLPVLSDVHSAAEVPEAARVLDVVQIPAFLCRQTRLIEAVAATGRPANIKKGQFMEPGAMVHVVEKFRAAGGSDAMLTERGTSFGYGDLVVDFRGFERMRVAGCPVIFDVTHSLQRPGGLGASSGGDPGLVPVLARAAAAVPVDGFFLETHPEPESAQSDAASMLSFDRLGPLLRQLSRIHALACELWDA